MATGNIGFQNLLNLKSSIVIIYVFGFLIMKKTATREKKVFARYKKPLVEFPNLIENQLVSFNWLVESGLKEIFKEFSPINDYSEKKFQLDFISFVLGESKFDEEYTKINKLTYEGQLKASVTSYAPSPA
jgi:DNA-directed RNA polymerase subunit beta